MNLSDVSIQRPVFAAMLILGLVVLGVISVGRLEMRLDPDLEFPFARDAGWDAFLDQVPPREEL